MEQILLSSSMFKFPSSQILLAWLGFKHGFKMAQVFLCLVYLPAIAKLLDCLEFVELTQSHTKATVPDIPPISALSFHMVS